MTILRRWLPLLLLGCLTPVAAEPLLSENFDTVANGELPAGWRVDGGHWAVQDGQLRAEPTSYISRVILPLGELDNVAVEATVTFVAAKNDSRWMSLMVRGAPNAPGPFMTFTSRVNRDQESGLEFGLQRATEGTTRWTIWRRGRARGTSGLNVPHRLRVEVRGQRMRGLLDGAEILSGRMPNSFPTRGEVGLIVSDVTALFDDLIVEALPPPGPEDVLPLLRPVIIAHRGNSISAPENTLVALQEALDLGADGVEIDVRFSADGHLVLSHDATVDRATNGTGLVKDMTLAQLKELDAGIKMGAQYAGERIPTFEEVLDLVKGRGLVVLDLKQEGLLKPIAQAVRERDMAGQMIVCCWTDGQARDALQYLPEAPACKLGAMPPNPTPEWFTGLLAKGLRSLSMNQQSLTPEGIQMAHLRLMPVIAWTANDPDLCQLLRDFGVDGIITDDPAAALKAVQTPTPAPGAPAVEPTP